MRRLVSRILAGAAARSLRISRRLYVPPREARTRPWFRDRGDATLRLDYDLDESSLVLDVGGFEGQWASDIFGRFACRVRIFEPVPEFADRIAARFRRNPRITLHRVALAASSGRTTLRIAGDESSVLRAGGDRREIEMVRAADFFAEERIDRVDVMKINIEGGEYDLLDHLLDSGLVRRIGNIQVQFHDFVPGAESRMAAIQGRLRASHDPTWQYPFVWENWALRSNR
jgi:FkbM family methyltransferase